jgi:hypothetical protein
MLGQLNPEFFLANGVKSEGWLRSLDGIHLVYGLQVNKVGVLPIINGKRRENGMPFQYSHPFRLRNSSKEVIILHRCSSNLQPKPEDSLWLLWKEERNPKRRPAPLFYLPLLLLVTILVSSNCFAEIIKSRAALTIDASTGEILFSKNSNWRLPPASTTKLVTAIVAIENEDLSKVVTISKKASRAARQKAGFKQGDQITIEGLFMPPF